MEVASIISLAIFLCIYVVSVQGAGPGYFHQLQENQQYIKGWNEPGLWRPKWIMERRFYATEDEKASTDKVVLRLNNDRSVTVYHQHDKRKFVDFGNGEVKEAKKKLFKKDLFEKDDPTSGAQRFMRAAKAHRSDGVWTWETYYPKPRAKVEIELRSKPRKKGGEREKIHHVAKMNQGKLDPYACVFEPGKIFKYKTTKAGIPLGTYEVGEFMIYPSPHRPLVSKDFQAFQ